MTKALSNDKSQIYHLIANEDYHFLNFQVNQKLLMVSLGKEVTVKCLFISGSEHIHWNFGL